MNVPQRPQLKLTALKQGQLILGEITGGPASKAMVYATLKKRGIKYGYHSENISKLVAGSSGQLPIAISEVKVDVVKFAINFVKAQDSENVDPYEFLAGLHDMEISGLVMDGDNLLTITSSSKRVLVKPDGSKIVISDTGNKEIHHFCGKNVRADEKTNSIYATKDGVAQITTRGKVSVFPFETIENIGKLNGKLKSELALLVVGDITGGANISSLATLIIRGVIKESTIRCGGDLDCVKGLDNLHQKDEGDVRVEQNLRTSKIKNFKVWVGSKLFAHQIIDRSVIEVLDTLACPRISDSRIAVCNSLITYNIVRDCVIKIGPGAVEDPFITRFKQTHLSRSRKHHDKHLALEFQKAYLEQLMQKTKLVVQRLQNEEQSNTTVGNVLRRYMTTLEESFQGYKNGYLELVALEKQVMQERAELAYNTSLMESFTNPSIVVVGKMEAGTRIVGPSNSIMLEKSMSSIVVTLDHETQNLVFSPLSKQAKSINHG